MKKTPIKIASYLHRDNNQTSDIPDDVRAIAIRLDENTDLSQPGNWYIYVARSKSVSLVAGPYPTHGGAVAAMNGAKDMAETVDAMSFFYTWGTCRMADDYTKPGVLNDLLELEKDML